MLTKIKCMQYITLNVILADSSQPVFVTVLNPEIEININVIDSVQAAARDR